MQRKRERVSECVEMDELVDISEDEVAALGGEEERGLESDTRAGSLQRQRSRRQRQI